MSLSCRTLALIFRNIFLIHGQVIKHQHTHPKCATGNQPHPRVCVYESCTACIVGVARGTSAMTSDSGGEHPADSVSGPSGCPRYREKLPYQVLQPAPHRLVAE
jgi:hypothetical protein